jgi:hypothetical protein
MSEPLTLAEFAATHRLSAKTARKYAKRGLILGAQRLRSGTWMVHPPAKLLSVWRSHQRLTSDEVLPVERRPRTEAEFGAAAPFLQTGVTGRPTYYADPFVLACCRTIAAAAAAIGKRQVRKRSAHLMLSDAEDWP